jgi:ABC-type polar amino acid transport system ATPase subunit
MREELTAKFSSSGALERLILELDDGDDVENKCGSGDSGKANILRSLREEIVRESFLVRFIYAIW